MCGKADKGTAEKTGRGTPPNRVTATDEDKTTDVTARYSDKPKDKKIFSIIFTTRMFR